MIILSQDKEHIVNFENIKEIRIGYAMSIRVDIFKNYELTLGYYQTEERAKEVLQEIIQEYKNCNMDFYQSGYGYVQNRIYEMPKE